MHKLAAYHNKLNSSMCLKTHLTICFLRITIILPSSQNTVQLHDKLTSRQRFSTMRYYNNLNVYSIANKPAKTLNFHFLTNSTPSFPAPFSAISKPVSLIKPEKVFNSTIWIDWIQKIINFGFRTNPLSLTPPSSCKNNVSKILSEEKAQTGKNKTTKVEWILGLVSTSGWSERLGQGASGRSPVARMLTTRRMSP